MSERALRWIVWESVIRVLSSSQRPSMSHDSFAFVDAPGGLDAPGAPPQLSAHMPAVPRWLQAEQQRWHSRGAPAPGDWARRCRPQHEHYQPAASLVGGARASGIVRCLRISEAQHALMSGRAGTTCLNPFLRVIHRNPALFGYLQASCFPFLRR